MPALTAEEEYEYEAVSRDGASSEALVSGKIDASVGGAASKLSGSARQQRLEVRRPIWRRLGMAMFIASAVVAIGGGIASLGVPRFRGSPARTPVPSQQQQQQPLQAARPLTTAHDVVNVLSAYAELGRLPAETDFDTVQQRVQEVAGDMSAKDVSRTLDAYARMKRRPEHGLLTALGQRAEQVVGDMDAEDVTHMINAYAELDDQGEFAGTAVATALSSP